MVDMSIDKRGAEKTDERWWNDLDALLDKPRNDVFITERVVFDIDFAHETYSWHMARCIGDSGECLHCLAKQRK